MSQWEVKSRGSRKVVQRPQGGVKGGSNHGGDLRGATLGTADGDATGDGDPADTAKAHTTLLALETKMELQRRASEVEQVDLKTAAMGLRTKAKPAGRRSQMEPKVQTGRRPTKGEPVGRGSPVEL